MESTWATYQRLQGIILATVLSENDYFLYTIYSLFVSDTDWLETIKNIAVSR